MASTFMVVHAADATVSEVLAVAKSHAAAQGDVRAGATWHAREPITGSVVISDDVYQYLTATVFEWEH